MGALLVPLVIIVVLVVLALVAARAWMGRRTEVADELASPESPTLDYVVPAGQDPVVVLTALSADGYVATADPTDVHLIHISCPSGEDRERARVRATIESVHTTAIDDGAPIDSGPVRFVDER
jgi:hypothetical protein